MVRKEVPEANKPKHGPSGTRSKFQTVGSRNECSTASCNSRSCQCMRCGKRTHENLREKLNAKRASQRATTSSGTPWTCGKNGEPWSSSPKSKTSQVLQHQWPTTRHSLWRFRRQLFPKHSPCLRYPSIWVPLIPQNMLSYTMTKSLSRV